MRLSSSEQKAIVESFWEVFGSGKIYLFGSRVDSDKKGGDIDLFVISRGASLDKKHQFLALLKTKIPDQKIDVIISSDQSRSIEQEALSKGVDLTDYKSLKIEQYLNECDKHKIRIESSFGEISHLLPLTSTKYQNLDESEIRSIDQYLFRFAKMQDTLGSRLFKLVASRFENNIDKLTFADILNTLEKAEILESAREWQLLREARNEISHQYEDDPEETAEALNKIFAQKDTLLNAFQNIKKFYEAKK